MNLLSRIRIRHDDRPTLVLCLTGQERELLRAAEEQARSRSELELRDPAHQQANQV